MAVTIIIKDGDPNSRGKSRTKMDRELKEKWGTTSFRHEGDADKAFAEADVVVHGEAGRILPQIVRSLMKK